MPPPSACPVCLNNYGTSAAVHDGVEGWGFRVDCPICGRFDLVKEAYDDFLDPLSPEGHRLTALGRARIAYRLRTATTFGPAGLPKLTSDFLEAFIKDGCPGPSPGEQAVNAVKFIGNEINGTGERIAMIQRDFFAVIGAPSPALAADLLSELQRRGIVDCMESASIGMPIMFQNVNLTLSGWETYENERKGRTSGNYGFLAMKFGDSQLDPLARDIIKPAVKAELNFDLFDMRDVARAGVIDNIMRAQIRDAAFVIVDLTHDNSGAYWEAGYAEGLGKPVIYICEKAKFNAATTHFDTNHCTTVVWNATDTGVFVQQLVATLRRSLNLF